MSIMSKVTEAVVQFIPDRDRDRLSEADRLIGKPIDRLDGPDKVQGSAPFAAEFPVENVAHAALVYSSIAKGKVQEYRHSGSGEGGRRSFHHYARERSQDERSSAVQP